MRNVLAGNLLQTASAGQDTTHTISPKGIKSQDINFASCTQPMVHDPQHLPPALLTATQISNLKAALTGNAAPTQCAGRNLGDNAERTYVTADVGNSCSTLNPGDARYSTNVTTPQNHLTGEVYYVDPSNSIARDVNVGHIHTNEN